jgi:hypothetical protein
MLSTYIDTDRYKVFDHTEQNDKITQLLTLLKDPEIQIFLKTFVEATIATSDLKILQRLSKVEAILGLLDKELLEDDEEQEPSIPTSDRVQKIDTTLKPELLDRSLVLPSKNITEIRADFLIDYMRTATDLPKGVSPFVNIDTKVMDSRDFKKFVENYLPEDYQPESFKNIRKIKRDVFAAAENRFLRR